MNGTEFWKSFVRSVIDEHNLVVCLGYSIQDDSFDLADERTVGQIAEACVDAFLEFRGDYIECPRCEGRGRIPEDPMKLCPTHHCGGSGFIRQRTPS